MSTEGEGTKPELRPKSGDLYGRPTIILTDANGKPIITRWDELHVVVPDANRRPSKPPHQ